MLKDKLRPLVFICHGVGGIICKMVRRPIAMFLNQADSQKVLVLAKVELHYQKIYEYTKAVVFMGTPHAGSKIPMSLTAVGPATGRLRTDFFQDLRIESPFLRVLALSFSLIASKLEIISCYETLALDGLKEPVSLDFPTDGNSKQI